MERRMKAVEARSGTFRSRLPYRRIVALLLESALPFTLIGILGASVTFCMDAKGGAHNWAVYAFPIIMVLWLNSLVSHPCFVAQLGLQS